MMKSRLITFICWTMLCIMPLVMSFDVKTKNLAKNYAKCEVAKFEDKKCNKRLIIKALHAVLVWGAWLLYFVICYRWVRFGWVEKNIRIIGAITGTLALLSVPLFAMVYVLPAVFLMLYIHFRVPYSEKA